MQAEESLREGDIPIQMKADVHLGGKTTWTKANNRYSLPCNDGAKAVKFWVIRGFAGVRQDQQKSIAYVRQGFV